MVGIIVSYENCSPATFTQTPASAAVADTGNNTGATGTVLKSLHPVLAVRGINCMACHAVINSNVVTDFGADADANGNLSGNFFTPSATTAFFPSNGASGARNAFNNWTGGGSEYGAWQSMNVTGSVIVPKYSMTATQANTLFGKNKVMALTDFLSDTTIAGNSPNMLSGVTPLAGQPSLVSVSSVKITYPSQAEILNLVPAANRAAAVSVTPIFVDTNLGQSSQSGLVVDGSGKFIVGSGAISCHGDVVVKGPLFLNNIVLTTDSSGCRLYVSQSVFIQGSLVYSGAGNLQITSARAVLMGFSAKRMGALAGSGVTAGSVSSVRINGSTDITQGTTGGPWARFPVYEDGEYNPSGGNINGVANHTFFDQIVSDAVLIGSALLDAGDASAIAGARSASSASTWVSTETCSGPASDECYPGDRVAVNYSHLLLNAPHIHSRYAGYFNGALIGDVVMLARNPQGGSTVQQFSYDSVFDAAPTIFPALTTNILQINP